MSARYSQCDETCTVDCGHCKGSGPPSRVPLDAERPAVDLDALAAKPIFRGEAWLNDHVVLGADERDALVAEVRALREHIDELRKIRELDAAEVARLARATLELGRDLVIEGERADALAAKVARVEAQRDDALVLLADAVPDPKGAIDSPQWHRRMDRLANSLPDGTAREFNDARQNPLLGAALPDPEVER